MYFTCIGKRQSQREIGKIRRPENAEVYPELDHQVQKLSVDHISSTHNTFIRVFTLFHISRMKTFLKVFDLNLCFNTDSFT